MEVLNRALDVDGASLEAQLIGDVGGRLTLVFLHEGLGSVAQWKDFPRAVAEAAGLPALVYSRAGYGRSSSCALPRPLTYMQDHARDVLPRVLEVAGVREHVLVGHSDGASIALSYAGRQPPNGGRLRGLVLEAPHVICEDVSVRSIEKAREAYEHGDLRARLAKYHGANVDCAFRGWNDAWLDPGFRAFDLRPQLPLVSVPTLVLQGEDDEYGTRAQVEAIAEGVRLAPVTVRMLAACGHAPHRDQPENTLREILTFLTNAVVATAH